MLMRTKLTILETMQCGLEITANARKGITKWAKDEHAFFRLQDAFYVHIEKRPENRNGNMSFTIFFDNETNNNLSQLVNDRVAVMECVYKNEGFLATGFHVRGRREPVRTNRRLPTKLTFNIGRSSAAHMPIELYTALRELPIAQERSEYVEKRIASWEGYLRIQEINADVEDQTASFTHARFNEDFSKLHLSCNGLQGKGWHAIKGFSAKLIGLQHDIGNVVNVQRAKQIVEIELNQKYKEMARRNEWHPNSYKEVVFSNFAELSQVRRLRKGFKDLQDGLAANANLEKVLFEERPVVRISKEKKDLVFHNQLNEFQREAVTGAMTSNDLFVIQGPPGTGKTTVISEICHQNVKAGLRTLVASQANLAVDNALGRLLSHQDIRILRYGRTDSIEEEGKKFIEENVAINWKNQTVDAVNKEIQSHTTREAELKVELANCEEQVQQLQNELVSLDEKVKLKEVAHIDHLALSNKLTQLNTTMTGLNDEHVQLVNNQENLKKSAENLTEEINKLDQVLQSESISPEITVSMEKLEQRLEILRAYKSYFETDQLIKDTKSSIAKSQHELDLKTSKIKELAHFSQEIQSITKLNQFKDHMHHFGYTPPSKTNQKLTELDQLIGSIKPTSSSDAFDDWKKLNNRLLTAIEKVETLLKEHGFLKFSTNRTVNQQYLINKRFQSVEGITRIINNIGHFIINPSTQKTLETRNYSAQKYEYLEKIADALALLQNRRNHVMAQGELFLQQQEIVLNSKKMFAEIKTSIAMHIDQTVVEVEQEKNVVARHIDGLEKQLVDYQQTNLRLQKIIGEIDVKLSIATVQEELDDKEELISNYKSKIVALKKYTDEIENKKNDLAVTTNEIKEKGEVLQSIDRERESLGSEISELEKQLAVLSELLKRNPEKQREETLISFKELSKRIEKLRIEKERLPITNELQKEWFSLLKEASDYDLDEMRKLYVQHANVIGTTCVASARRDFMEEYPTFDVVIIDEVSKATPPELLLPMLKGKKIILVGDHHQLPPLMGQETIEELLEESDNHEEKRELEKLLQESLFERLFRTLPKQNKTMLGIQYRMHESIMETIAPFYEEGDYSLQCGLTDSDADRDHLLESQYIKRQDHLLWFDMPNEPHYFEERVKGGTSRFNQAELSKIKRLLIDLEAATMEAKQAGRMKLVEKKSVGVISFYGEQVKRIDRLIEQDLNPQHLHCRTGSVDKFQGMEMDIIILSFVRNHDNKGGDIGFAKDYRRLNVALSRARELLIIVGSSEMFTMRTKDANSRKMYGRLVNNIKEKNGFTLTQIPVELG